MLSPWFLSRQLCLLLNAENIFHSMADILLREEDLKFASTMVHTLNTILLTSSELFQLRNQLKDLRTPVWAAGAGSAAAEDVMGVVGTWEATWEHVLLLSPHLVGPRTGTWVPGVALSFLLSSGVEGGLEDMPNSCFSPLRWEQATQALEQLPPPSTLTQARGQVTARAEPPVPQLSLPGMRPQGLPTAATSTGNTQARRGEGGKLLLLLLWMASNAVVSSGLGQPPFSSPNILRWMQHLPGPPQNLPDLHLPRPMGSRQSQAAMVAPQMSLRVLVALASPVGWCWGPGALGASSLLLLVTQPRRLPLSPGKP